MLDTVLRWYIRMQGLLASSSLCLDYTMNNVSQTPAHVYDDDEELGSDDDDDEVLGAIRSPEQSAVDLSASGAPKQPAVDLSTSGDITRSLTEANLCASLGVVHPHESADPAPAAAAEVVDDGLKPAQIKRSIKARADRICTNKRMSNSDINYITKRCAVPVNGNVYGQMLRWELSVLLPTGHPLKEGFVGTDTVTFLDTIKCYVTVKEVKK
jgi:hypothetical protein